MSNAVNRFLGGSPFRVIVKLALMSLIVGLVMSAFNIHPLDIIARLQHLAWTLWHMGFDAIEVVLRYLLIGAVLVVPIWLILRFLDMGRKRE